VCHPLQYSTIFVEEKGCLKLSGTLAPNIPQTPYISSDRPQKFAYTNNSKIIANTHDENISVIEIRSNVVVRGVAIA
jgi:hypothetical protein